MSSENNYQKLQEVLKKAPESRHSFFQMKYFIIGKEPTIQGQLWQCLRELQSRKATIDNLNLSIDETKDQISLIEIDKAKETHKSFIEKQIPEELRAKERVIRCRQYERKKEQLEKSLMQLEETLQFTWQEATFFLQMFEMINEQENVKNYDDFNSQKEYWNEKIAQQINLKLLLQQPLDTELVQTARSLHEDAPVRIQIEKTLEHISCQMQAIKDRYLENIKEQNGKKENN